MFKKIPYTNGGLAILATAVALLFIDWLYLKFNEPVEVKFQFLVGILGFGSGFLMLGSAWAFNRDKKSLAYLLQFLVVILILGGVLIYPLLPQ